MGLVRTWTGQVARAAGASLLAPLVLLLAAGALASVGGLGGLGSLDEISSGPTLPETGLSAAPGRALADAQIGRGSAAPAADVATPPASPIGATASAAAPAPGRAADGPRPRDSDRQGLTRNRLAPARPPSRGTGVITTPAPSTPPRAAPGPLQDLGEVTRELGEAIGAPLDPLTDAIVGLLRRPPPR
ncbi:MAG TPA: hypothetical protein VGV10_02840 [Thermoleophilaceae bacterium]|nr:hypothetical protein [Thermoleophilaceae bacterium]